MIFSHCFRLWENVQEKNHAKLLKHWKLTQTKFSKSR